MSLKDDKQNVVDKRTGFNDGAVPGKTYFCESAATQD